jgi:type I restriction enzyme M protein
MPSKRDVLALLSRDELLAVADRFELAPPDRRAKDGLVATIAGSKRATLAEVLPDLPRERLKELCRALGLDDAGKEKAELVDRLVGAKSNGEPAPASKPNGAARSNGAEQVELPVGEKLTTDKLERYLWSAADILRGSIDSSDYKNFIFGLLFLKRLSDRFDEECEALRSQQPNADPDDPDEHDFSVPKRARWSEIQKVATGIGEALNKGCAELEQRNDKLEGVLAGIDFNDERKLGDTKNRDSVLSRLVQHFGCVDLRNANLVELDGPAQENVEVFEGDRQRMVLDDRGEHRVGSGREVPHIRDARSSPREGGRSRQAPAGELVDGDADDPDDHDGGHQAGVVEAVARREHHVAEP